MSKTLSPLVLLAAIILFSESCKSKDKSFVRITDDKAYKFDNKYNIVLQDSIQLALDTFGSFNTPCTQFKKLGNTPCFSFLNTPTHQIYIFNLDTKELIKKVPINLEGPNAVGTTVDGYFIHNMDSIFVIARYNVCIIDTSGKMLYKNNLAKYKGVEFTALPGVAENQPFLFKDGKLYMGCVADKNPLKTADFKDNQSQIIFDLKKREYTYKYRYPDPYREGVFGVNFMVFFSTYNPDNDMFVFSYPADNYLYSAGRNSDEMQEHYAGSKYLDPIKPMEKIREDFMGYTKFYTTSPSYQSIYYDNYRKLYYRVAYHPRTEEEFKNRIWWKKKNFIFLDQNFNKVGETDILDEYLIMDQVFFDEKYVYIGCSSKEGEFKIKTFKIEANS